MIFRIELTFFIMDKNNRISNMNCYPRYIINLSFKQIIFFLIN